ncbi:HET-domain-containing protein [Hyaloscypha bicolor E]|uniref:HET-domain-containing protein n=1 Tax=Hyaloscypha bicolor E TaxID=1095630 RepID=A0A2J6T2P4_9HELO|nr:HET-domain-containing protein [Hyaloscypha bicolor E]PMD57286.1 HET-domain-containing protein [Hyaloscypha bicolor E]
MPSTYQYEELPTGKWMRLLKLLSGKSRNQIPTYQREESPTGKRMRLMKLLSGKSHSQMPTYQYEELPTGKWIRLMKLLPGNSDDQIHLELFTAELESAPPYEAISYCWGDPNDQEEILCCGRSMYITRSLYSGLKCFRYPQKTRILWADAVCINQSNDNDKGHQVNMMGDVYDHASTVLVWLGEASTLAAEKAFHLIRKINGYMDSKILESELANNPYEAVVDVPKPETRSQLFQDDSESEALRDFFRRPWFDRLWVLQEVALASSAWVYYGATSISLTEVVQFAFVLIMRPDLQNNFLTGRVGDAFQNVFCTYAKKNTWIQEKSILRHARDYIERSAKPAFQEILDTGRRFGTTKPHDHIYAFLGHPSARAKDGSVGILEADYTLDIEDVYRQLSERLYERDRRLDFLCNVFHYDPSSIEQAQSWAPKYHNGGNRASMYWLGWNVDNSAEMEMFIKVDFHNSMLHGRSLLFDSIATFTETFKEEDFESMSPTPVEICWNLEASFTESMDIDERLRDFRWTMAGGSYTGGEARLQRDFESYCMEKTSSEFCASIQLGNFSSDETSLANGDWKRFESVALIAMAERKFFITKDGRFGLGPSLLQDGDICCVFMGCRMPLIIRPTSTPNHLKVVGPSYIHGVMHGEVVKARVKSLSDLTEITLV